MQCTIPIIIGCLGFIVGVYSALVGLRYRLRKQRIAKYIKKVRRQIRMSLDGEKKPTEKARLAHAEVKKLHRDVSMHIGQIATGETVDKVSTALAGARIFYWVRQFEGEDIEDIRKLMNERFFLWTSRRVRQSSYEYVLNYVDNIEDVDNLRRKIDLKELREQCESDIAELKPLLIQLAVSTQWDR